MVTNDLEDNMRHALINKKAKFIDKFIDEYKKVRNRTSFLHKEVAMIIHFLFPGSSYSGRGAFKTVHKVSSRARDLVLKTSNPRNIRNDERAYKRFPEKLRNRYFSKIYWRTKYCLLQKYGKGGKVPEKRMTQLKSVAKRYGLTDVRPANIRKVDGRFKIVDANIRKSKK